MPKQTLLLWALSFEPEQLLSACWCGCCIGPDLSAVRACFHVPSLCVPTFRANVQNLTQWLLQENCNYSKMDGRPFAGTQCSNAYGMDLHARTVLLQGCNALGEPCIAQCLFIACTEYDHLLFTACSLSADIVAGNPSSGAVLVDPHEDSPSRPTQVSRSASRGLEAVFGRSSGWPWSTTAEWAPVEHSAWAWPVIYQDSADPMVYQDSADPWTPSGPFGRVGFPYYMIDLRFDLHAVNIHAQSWTCLLLSNMIWTWFHVLEHDFMFSNMESCP